MVKWQNSFTKLIPIICWPLYWLCYSIVVWYISVKHLWHGDDSPVYTQKWRSSVVGNLSETIQQVNGSRNWKPPTPFSPCFFSLGWVTVQGAPTAGPFSILHLWHMWLLAYSPSPLPHKKQEPRLIGSHLYPQYLTRDNSIITICWINK